VDNAVLAVESNAFINPRLYFLSLRERIKVRVLPYPNLPRSGF
jgi:hypothetical protein